MELDFPGFWKFIWFVGILLSFAGSSLLAYLGTNHAKKLMERITRGRASAQWFGYAYLKRKGEISEQNKSLNHEDSFKGLVEFILSMGNRGEYTVPRNPEIPVERVELDESRRVDDEVVLVFTENLPTRVSDSRRSATKISIEDLKKEVEHHRASSVTRHEDAATQYSWGVFSLGALLQLMGFIAENFVIW